MRLLLRLQNFAHLVTIDLHGADLLGLLVDEFEQQRIAHRLGFVHRCLCASGQCDRLLLRDLSPVSQLCTNFVFI